MKKQNTNLTSQKLEDDEEIKKQLEAYEDKILVKWVQASKTIRASGSQRRNLLNRSIGSEYISGSGFLSGTSPTKSTLTSDRRESFTNTHSSYREKIVQEIFDTEQFYVNSLKLCVESFLGPLRSMKDIKLVVDEIFGNIEEVLQVNTALLADLRSLVMDWDKEESKVGKVLYDMAPFLKPYYVKYTENYPHGLDTLKQYEKTPIYAAWAEERIRYGDMDIVKRSLVRDLLIMPVQRIPRYNLLLADLIKHTDLSHKDYETLKMAQVRFQQVANDVDRAIILGENRQKIWRIQDSFIKTPKLVEPHRIFIKEGPLKKACRNSVKSRYFFLFNDILIYSSNLIGSNSKFICQQIFPIDQIRLEDLPHEPEDKHHAFHIKTPLKSFEVYASSHAEKVDWLVDITNAVDMWKAKRATYGILTDSNDFEGAPIWVPNKYAQSCAVCSEAFGVLRRRHHCRNCGNVVCGTCSPHQIRVKNRIANSDRVRVCSPCFESIDKKKGSERDSMQPGDTYSNKSS